jgi:hypothetical protein
MVKVNSFCIFSYHAIMLFRIIEARLHALLISLIERMNDSFIPLILERTWVSIHRTGERVGHITFLI